jgi:hypothetical protein
VAAGQFGDLERQLLALRQAQVESYNLALLETKEGYMRQVYLNAAGQLHQQMIDQLNILSYQAWLLQAVDKDPQIGRITTARQEKENAERGARYLITQTNNEIIQQAAQQLPIAMAEAVSDLGKLYQRTYNNRWRQVVRINREIGLLAIKDMVRHYDRTFQSRHSGAYGEGQGSASAGYREGERYAGGLLRRALASPLQAQATQDGVIFGNTDLLDATARHWARLNFGAGPRAGRKGGPLEPMISPYQGKRFNANESFLSEALGLPQVDVSLPMSARGTFWMPAGLFLEKGNLASATGPNRTRRGLDAFYPAGHPVIADAEDRIQEFNRLKKRERIRGGATLAGNNQGSYGGRKITQGVQAWGFMEAGAASIARNLGPANRDYLLGILDEARKEGQALKSRNIVITPKRVTAAAKLLRRVQ